MVWIRGKDMGERPEPAIQNYCAVSQPALDGLPAKYLRLNEEMKTKSIRRPPEVNSDAKDVCYTSNLVQSEAYERGIDTQRDKTS